MFAFEKLKFARITKKCIFNFVSTERLEAQTIDPLSISYGNVSVSSLSLFSTTAQDMENDKTSSTESIAKTGKGRFALSRVKNVTKCAAKKINRIFVKAKSKLLKPLQQEEPSNVSIASSYTQLTDFEPSHEDSVEFEEINPSDVSSYSCQSTTSMEENEWDYCDDINESHRSSNDSFNSASTSISFDLKSSRNSKNTSWNSSSSSSLMHQIFAESIADLNMICAQNGPVSVKPSEVKKFIRKKPPHKLKMPQQLTLYDGNSSAASYEKSESNENEVMSINEESFDYCDDIGDLPVQVLSREKIAGPEPKPKSKEGVIQKETFGKRITRKFGEFWKHMLANQGELNEVFLGLYYNAIFLRVLK